MEENHLKSMNVEERLDYIENFYHHNPGTPSVIEMYNKWSETYQNDQWALPAGYNHPKYLANFTNEFIEDKKARILDVCCGTGFSAQYLQQYHFENIDGIDGAEKMLHEARKTGFYKNLFQEMIDGEKFNTIEDNSYDVVISSGSFVPGHLKSGTVNAIAKILKPGGTFIGLMRLSFLSTCDDLKDLKSRVEALADSGFWEILRCVTVPNYHDGFEGQLFVCRRSSE